MDLNSWHTLRKSLDDVPIPERIRTLQALVQQVDDKTVKEAIIVELTRLERQARLLEHLQQQEQDVNELLTALQPTDTAEAANLETVVGGEVPTNTPANQQPNLVYEADTGATNQGPNLEYGANIKRSYAPEAERERESDGTAFLQDPSHLFATQKEKDEEDEKVRKQRSGATVEATYSRNANP